MASPSRPLTLLQAPLKLGMEVVYFGTPGVIPNVVRGLDETLAASQVDCVGGMATP
jgi:hypothetical protein